MSYGDTEELKMSPLRVSGTDTEEQTSSLCFSIETEVAGMAGVELLLPKYIDPPYT